MSVSCRRNMRSVGVATLRRKETDGEGEGERRVNMGNGTMARAKAVVKKVSEQKKK